MLTIQAQHDGGWRAVHSGVGHHVPHHTRVVPHVGGLHLGYVQVTCMLGDETTSVLLQEAGPSVENPRIFDLCERIEQQKTASKLQL